MKVAYLTPYDSTDVRYWSGLGYYIAQSLEQQGVELIRVDCSVKFTLPQRIRRRWAKMFHHRIRQIEREPAYLRRVAGKIREKLSGREYDIIFAPGSLPVSYLRTDKPIVFFTDATYDCMTSQHEGPNLLSRQSIAHGHQAEQQAIHKASLIIYTSEWAIQNAMAVYRASQHKMIRLSFGPNLPIHWPVGGMEKILSERRGRQKKTFLWVGVDWHRKGAARAVEVVSGLNERGIPAQLIIVGCRLPEGTTLPHFVIHYSFISKTDHRGMARLQQLFRTADFFILPTRSDYTPIVFSEAAGYGLPVITTNVGGCRSVVLDGVTGFCCSPEHFVEEAIQKLSWLCTDEEAYETFCLDAFYHYKQMLNWEVTGRKIVAAMRQLINNPQLTGLSVTAS